MVKKLFPLISIILIASFALAACGPTATQTTVATEAPVPTTVPAAGGEVYYLNFKPEVAEIYTKIADAYKAETGVTLKVVTAAAGTYA